MSERSELQQHGAFLGAQRRGAHWCPVDADTVKHLDKSMVHQ
jgi:hypothetical protein